jgi:hypothetical protein
MLPQFSCALIVIVMVFLHVNHDLNDLCCPSIMIGFWLYLVETKSLVLNLVHGGLLVH